MLYNLIEGNKWLTETDIGDANRWRSFIPKNQAIVRFQAIPRSNVKSTEQPSIMHNLMSCLLSKFTKDTKSVRHTIVFIVGGLDMSISASSSSQDCAGYMIIIGMSIMMIWQSL